MRWAALGLTLVTPALMAASLVTETPMADAPPGTVGLGFGLRFGESPYQGIDNVSSINNDNGTDLIPLYLYEGKYLFAHGTSAGVHLVRNDWLKLDLIGRYRFDRLEPDADPAFIGLEPRRQTVDGGLEATLKSDYGHLRLGALWDLLGRHQGGEMEVTYLNTFSPARWRITPYVSYLYQTEDLLDYYYSVPSEIPLPPIEPPPPTFPEYAVNGGDHFWRVGVNTSYQLSAGWHLYANLAWETVPDKAKASPMVERDQLVTGLVGATYYFGDLQQSQVGEQRSGEWSLRINGGYTAEETFHKVHRGYVRESEDVETYLVGLTVGRLLNDGETLDAWGRFSLNRRLENDYQDDFFEYVAYVMLMGTGYSPWSEQEWFRYGFGFGFSYADQVPIIEQVKQAERGRETAHFLNYLEATVDFPTNLLLGNLGSKDCYIGLTIVHRSGIFANSDILGNVSGGSDVLTGHLECRL
ncbi:MipA/OmpV family protein [Ferrimonas balearica]|uniref:MipA/OmpV family protein n=1 Tax=Ferrimonas balearica TaxID=44012 RepID=UPI001C997AF6|nr:MipA/OmpV family protein [Ferrimonas balearica]MBY5992225.1 MipA/OmpV family protein [Ferrimonas balearica]